MAFILFVMKKVVYLWHGKSDQNSKICKGSSGEIGDCSAALVYGVNKGHTRRGIKGFNRVH